ncbi:MAG: prolipoprotein diacylglyceryl transferase [Cyanobacteria bacterium REEB67]|nr:prolipoprotein diacylglyceryl transferase [Cyanobacteria bacterium REEB67]
MLFQSPGPIICKIGFLTVRWYGMMIASGFLLALMAARKLAHKHGLDAEKFVNLALWSFLIGVLGARLYYVSLNIGRFLVNPGEILATWNGGLSIHGGIVGGIIAACIYCKREKLSIPKYLDLLACVIPLAQSVGRWGNFFNSEAYGLPVSENFPLRLFIPPESRPMMYHNSKFFHPTFLYESVYDFALFAFLYFFAYKRLAKYPGLLLCIYITGYSLGRIVIEQIRIDAIASYKGLPVPLLVSAGMLAVALCGMLYTYKRGPESVATTNVPASTGTTVNMAGDDQGQA